ncbi:MAG: ribonuclease III [Spirochaetes bacterium]|nr:ribonuclease III [Spirochaetota bacterium]
MKNKIDKNRKKELYNFFKILKIRFKDIGLLNKALTHSSYAHEMYSNEEHNEKFEFLGDSLLSMLIVEYLFLNYKTLREGDLSKLKSYIVSEEVLYSIAGNIELNKFLLLGKGEEITGGREKRSLISDALEGVIGAYYIDSGLKKCRALILRLFKEVIEHNITSDNIFDHKSELQKKIQKKYKSNPEYYLIEEDGPDHKKIFKVGVRLNSKVLGVGKGKNKRVAEKEAAKKALENF